MRYDPVNEKPYCCVPAVLQMIQARRGLPFKSQDDIGWDLGLIVPLEIKSKFTKVRTGPEPETGYGTQTFKPEFSIENYFNRNQLPLSIKILLLSSFDEMISIIELSLKKENDVVLCFNSRHLFGDGDLEHVSLIESYDRVSNHVKIIDPSIRAPRIRSSSLLNIFNTLQNHGISKNNGLWIISDRKYDT